MFRGTYTALATPLHHNQLDESAICRLAEQQISAGISGLVPCGTTGEASTLTTREHLRVVELVVKTAAGRVPVLAGAGANDTQKAIELARACKDLGATGTLQVTPYYNKPPQAGLIAHFIAIAEASDLPVVVYNVPGRTGVDLLPESVATLARHPGIVGIKEATGDMIRIARIRELLDHSGIGDNFDLLSGDDFTLLPFLALGGHGVISVTSNIAPQWLVNLCTAAATGDWNSARTWHYRQLPLCRALFAAPNPIPLKAALAILGRCGPEVRAPLLAIDPQSHEALTLADTLQSLGLQSS